MSARKPFNKKKVYEWTQKHINASNMRIYILFIPLMILLIREIASGQFVMKDFYDTSIIVSFLILFVCESLATLVLSFISKFTEDAVKLDQNYGALVDKYIVNRSKMVHIEQDGEQLYVPALVLSQRKLTDSANYELELACNVDANNKIKRYNLPGQVAGNSAELFKAHKNSKIYNNIDIRLDNFESADNKIKLLYSTTTYFDTLITNRAMDYKFKGARTIREIYEPGPIMSDLPDSRMSNHLEFNGFIELSDGQIVFVLRNMRVSVGKNTWSQSVGASLKTQYCMNEDYQLTIPGISRAIRKEIEEELMMDIDNDEDMTKYIFAFYRDLVEGGSPQFLFHYKTDKYDSKTYAEHFKKTISTSGMRRENRKHAIVDAKKLAFFTVEELSNARFEVDKMIIKNEKGHDVEYNMMPIAVASVIMLLQSLGKK